MEIKCERQIRREWASGWIPHYIKTTQYEGRCLGEEWEERKPGGRKESK